jgi:hypothetical protein
MAGKGDRYRHVDPKKWAENWEKSFGKDKDKKEQQQEDKDKTLEDKMNYNMQAEDLND